MPNFELFSGKPYKEFAEAESKARETVRIALDGKPAALIGEKLTAAYAAQPPDWNVVGLALEAATYAKPTPEIVEVAEKIAASVPPVEFGPRLVGMAMQILILSGGKKHVDFVFDYVSKGEFKKAASEREAWQLGAEAVGSLAQLPPQEARRYLARLAVQYPYNPKKAQSSAIPERVVSEVIRACLDWIRSLMSDRVIDITGMPMP